MIRTVYVTMTYRNVRSLSDWDPAKSRFGTDRRINPDTVPFVAGSNTRAHLDPLCKGLVQRGDSRVRAVPARVNGQSAQLLRRTGGIEIAICSYCRLDESLPLDDQRWRDNALCAPQNRPDGYENVQWVATTGQPQAERNRNTRAAREVCAMCPVVDDCVAYAVQSRQSFGVWGGMAAHDLRFRRSETIRAGEAV